MKYKAKKDDNINFVDSFHEEHKKSAPLKTLTAKKYGMDESRTYEDKPKSIFYLFLLELGFNLGLLAFLFFILTAGSWGLSNYSHRIKSEVNNLLTSRFSLGGNIDYPQSRIAVSSLAKVAGWAEDRSEEGPEPESDLVKIKDDKIGTNPNISRSINYKLDQGLNGSFVTLAVNYALGGEKNKGEKYSGELNIEVPEGSFLIEDKNRIKVSNIDGRTLFTVAVDLVSGEVKTFDFYYKLAPRFEDIIKNSGYILEIEKDNAQISSPLSVDLNFKNKIRSYSPVGFYSERSISGVKWDTEINSSRIFNVKIR